MLLATNPPPCLPDLSAANHAPGTWDEGMLQAGLHHLLQLSSAASATAVGSGRLGVGSSAGTGALIADFLVGSTASWQMRHVRKYAASQLGRGAGRRTVLLLSLCFWEEVNAFPP